MPRLRHNDARQLADRAAPLIEDAAERSRVSMRTRFERLRSAWRSILQAGVAAGLAWIVATELLGHEQPFFAPVSAIITLGLTVSERGRRAAEVAIGVALGIAVGDLLVLGHRRRRRPARARGHARHVARHLPRQRPDARHPGGRVRGAGGHAPAADRRRDVRRFLDALAGGSIALLVNAIVLPADPVAMLRSAARPVLDELAGTLDDIAVALLERDRRPGRARAAPRPQDRRAERPLLRHGGREP